MIDIKYREFYEARHELEKRLTELRNDVNSRITQLSIFEDCVTLEFNYCRLRAQQEVLDFIGHYLCDWKNNNWLTTNIVSPVKHPKDFKNLLQETMKMILKKEPGYGLKWNSIYFMTLHYLARIKIEENEDGT